MYHNCSPFPLRPPPLGVAAAPSVIFLERCGHGCDPDGECSHALNDDATEVLLYACKTIGRGEQLLLDYGEEFRGHDWSQAQPRMTVRRKCEHGRQRYECKECGGAGICEHNRIRSQCKECGGASICEHNRQRSYCKECGGGSICKHNRQRSRCKECGGASICEHNRQRYTCKECGGAGICEHNRRRSRCKECRVKAGSKTTKAKKRKKNTKQKPTRAGQITKGKPPRSKANA